MPRQVVRHRSLDRSSAVVAAPAVFGFPAADVGARRRALDSPVADAASARLTAIDLARRREDETYRLALPVLEELAAQLGPTEHVLSFFDAAGWILWTGGSARTAARLAELGFCAGASWPCETVPSDGPAAALEGRRTLGIASAPACGASDRRDWSTSVAPIRMPRSRELAGHVHLTAPARLRSAQELVAARAIAQSVEERLQSACNVREQVIEYAFRTASAAKDGMFAADRSGRMVAANDAARRGLAFDGLEVPPTVRRTLAALLERPGALDGQLEIEWPGVPGRVKLVASTIRYGQHAIGVVLRVLEAGHARRGAVRDSARQPRVGARYGFDQILGRSQAVRVAVELARMASRNDLPVVLTGESGTGKELFAHAIHSASGRRDGPLIAMNCGCIPAALLEAELFGYEAGTFTGGRRDGNAGKFEEANGGTIFLDEVSELSPQAQAAFLRVLQEREVVRLGGSSPRRVDIRVLAASNKSLPAEVQAGQFRADLFFRLNVLSIPVPPLRARREDVKLLARACLLEAEAQVGRSGLALSPGALAALEAYGWPGNVRELRNVILRSAATVTGEVIDVSDLPDEVRGAAAAAPIAAERALAAARPRIAGPDRLDRAQLLHALEASSWNVARTAQTLNVSRMTLYRWLRKHDISRCPATLPGM